MSTLLFFENIYLELFCLDDNSHLAQSTMTTEFNFFARVNWLETGASPFGFGLCYLTDHDHFFTHIIEDSRTEKTQVTEQPHGFLPVNLAYPEEPICCVVPHYVAVRNRLSRVLATSEQNLTQSLGIRQLTRVKLKVSSESIFTTPLLSLVTQNILDIEYRQHPLLELIFDHGDRQRRLDLRPLLPIVLKY
ncbi:MAG: hypothetical protein QNJ41_17255 [Xenococcaceae cyanobacterium MO_188.B32]|nr:hypothetical protein [Xenococcaceae cyanobacterium MO_188.B32]